MFVSKKHAYICLCVCVQYTKMLIVIYVIGLQVIFTFLFIPFLLKKKRRKITYKQCAEKKAIVIKKNRRHTWD